MPPNQVQFNGESFFWVPVNIPTQREALAFRGWRCGDATSFAESVRRVRKRPDCGATGYRNIIWKENEGRGGAAPASVAAGSSAKAEVSASVSTAGLTAPTSALTATAATSLPPSDAADGASLPSAPLGDADSTVGNGDGAAIGRRGPLRTGVASGASGAGDGRQDADATLDLEKTPDFIIWPHVHVAMRSLVAAGSKVVVILRQPLLRLASHHKHFINWMHMSHDRRAQDNVAARTDDAVMAILAKPAYVGSFAPLAASYIIDSLIDNGFTKLLHDITFHLVNKEGRGSLGVVEAYIRHLYRQCDFTDWVASCALKIGPVVSLYLPQLLSLIRFVGGCPHRWLRVVQSEQLFERPGVVLRELWRWLGVEGPLSLNSTSGLATKLPSGKFDSRGRFRAHRESPHRRRHSAAGELSEIPRGTLHDLNLLFSVWNGHLALLLEETGTELTPFDVSLWDLPEVLRRPSEQQRSRKT
eukprot:TRINITY_DN17442_c0_g1_i1.p1 TRINITY_DN17442_c0_g1~~TRINITY_DN17442_c0_g1_i1.p1  ORF type:complete len:473 (+),score=64.96 TRINITY_DN17442_c0_g1_i1:374-1792(+)